MSIITVSSDKKYDHMDIATSFSSHSDTNLAIREAIDSLTTKVFKPQLVLAYFSEHYDVVLLRNALSEEYPDAQILACSSCQGIMTDEGYISDQGIALWSVSDHYGAYGSAIVSTNQSPKDMARQAVLRAIENSGRPGELPALILLHATPGHEEEVISGIESEVGGAVPIIGGSAADDLVAGQWNLFTHHQIAQKGVGIVVFYPSCQVSYSFHSGYASSGLSAIATRVEGREVIELDGRPAMDVYQEWLGKTLAINDSIVSESSLNPLGRIAGTVHDLPYFKLAHPLRVTEQRGIELFAQVNEGEVLYFMEGTVERLVTRAGRVINSAYDISRSNRLDPIGGITIYCAGCMLKVKDRMKDVAKYVNIAMHNAPFVCPFTFGEQGQFVGGENAHGNLMISAVLFHRD